MGTTLFPEEEQALGRAVDRRRQEFIAGRACARIALGRLGIPPVPIPSGPRGEPRWPPGVRGSITHCRDLCACAVTNAKGLFSLGIDAETHASLPDGVLEQVSSERERRWALAGKPGLCRDRLLFSAKEAIYKAWYPLTGSWLGFDDVELSVDVNEQTFRGRLLIPGPVIDRYPLDRLEGRWRVARGIIGTAVVVGEQSR